jgi:hypothetical protein
LFIKFIVFRNLLSFFQDLSDIFQLKAFVQSRDL